MPQLENPETFQRADISVLLRKVGEVVAEESKKSLLFSADDIQQLPHFQRSEILTGRVAGRGTYGVIREIQSIRLVVGDGDSNGKQPRRFFRQSSSTASATMSKSTNNTNDAELSTRELLARRVWSRKGGKYVVKEVEKELMQTDRVTYLKGLIDLALEAKVLASLNHPHILSLRGVCATDPSEDASYFIILDQLEETLPKRLNAWMQQKRASQGITGALTGGKRKSKNLLTDRLLVAYDIAGVMNYLHNRDIIYRDLKADNVGFTADSELKLFDFGLAKELHDSDRQEDGLYRLTGFTGAVRYMAPEVGLRQPYNLKADVYSWSLLLWYIMALEPPFGLYTPKMFVDRVFGKNYRPAIKEKWPEELQNLMRESWDVDIDTRPSFQDIMDRLKVFVNELDPEVASFMNTSFRSNGA